MANEEVSNIGVKLSLDASNFTAGLGTAQGKLNSFQQQAAKAASGAGAAKAGANATPTTLKVAIEPAQLQAALTTAAKSLQTVHVPIDVDSRAIAAMRTKITQGLGVIPVQLAASFPKSGPGSAQAIIGTVFSSMTGVSTAKGQTLAKSAIEQVLPKRATGGPVESRQAVVVGEHRAEVFRPGASGFIEKDVQRYRQQAAQLAALEYEISRRQKNVHAMSGAYAKGGPVDFQPRALPPGMSDRFRYAPRDLGLLDERERMYPISTPQPVERTPRGPFSGIAQRLLGRASGGYTSGGKAMRPVPCPTCGLVNWQTMAGPARKSCFKCGAPLGMRAPGRHMGGMVAHRAYGGEASSLYGGDPAALEAAAIEHFGITDDIREAGFLTPSGKYLDFSGRHESLKYRRQADRWVPKTASEVSDPLYSHTAGKDYLAGQRSIDHYEASQILPGLTQSDAVDRMRNMGFIRVWGSSSRNLQAAGSIGAEMSRLPTMAQISRLVSAAREAEHVSVDAFDPMGYRLPEGSFRTEWPDDPVGGKRMGSFLRQATELIQQNDAKAEEVREMMRLGAGFNPNLHRAMGGSVEASLTKGQRSYLANVRAAAKRLSDPQNPYGRQSLEMGVQWYPEAQKWIAQQAQAYGLPEPTVRGITASLSAGTAWSSNKTKAQRILQAHAAGQPFPYQTTLDAHKKAKAILEGADPWDVLGHTPKVGQFYLNTGGDLDAITIDRWALRTGTRGAISQAGRGPVRSGVEAAFRRVAKDMGIPPVSLQAALWIQEKAETDVAAGRVPKLAKYMAQGGPVELAALWAKDPYLAIMAYEAQMRQKDQHRARGGRIARDFAGPPLAEVPGRMPNWYKGDQDWLDMMSGQYGWGATGPYQRYVTDEQWRGPEAGKPRVALPGMQNEPELRAILQSMALARHQKPRMSATGGPASAGLYIVNEQGDNSEGFVASQDEHLIPKFVMDRIPGARDGARTGMIRKPANSMFSPAQDGMIIPKWAVPYVPALHRAEGGPSGPDDRYSALPEIEAIEREERMKVVEATLKRSRAARAAYIPARENAGDELSIQRAGAGKVLPSRTPGGAIAAVTSYLFGGVKQATQAERERVEAQTAYNKAFTRTNVLTGIAKATQVGLAEELEKGNIQQKDYIEGLKKVVEPLREAKRAEAVRLDALTEATTKSLPTTGGIVKNLGVIIAATSAYGLAMQAANAVLQPAVDGTIQATKDFVDQTSGFGATATRVTTAIGTQLNAAGGNLEKTFGDLGLQDRMSASFTAFLEKTLGDAVVAKAAAANQGQQSDLFRATLGIGNAPTGLNGGYGGLFGTSFLASQLGGGKGFMEQIAGDINAAAAPKAGFQPEDFGRGLVFAQNQNFRDLVLSQAHQQGNPIGAAGDVAGGIGDILRAPSDMLASKDLPTQIAGGALTILSGALPLAVSNFFPKTQTPTANATGGYQAPIDLGKSGSEQAGTRAYLKNLADEAQRGAKALGQVSKFSYQVATSEDQLQKATDAAAASGDAYAVSMAANGVILADSTGKVVAGASDFADVAKQMAKGATIPDVGTFIQSQLQSIRAGFEVAQAQAQQALSVGIPGQLGTQLAAQPFMPAAAGVLPSGGGGFTGTIGGINVADALRQTQAIQDQLTAQAAAGRAAQEQFVGQQPGMQGPYTSDGQTFATGQDALHSFNTDILNAGTAITMWQTKIAGAQTQQQWAQFSNNLRLSNRAYEDALALAGRGGGGRGSAGELGGLERQQTLLGFMLSQKQINFQTAIAGFQAPGLTSEERAARQAQAQAEAKIAQQQLNIQKREFTVSAGRGVTDTGAALKLLKSEQATQTAVAAAQKAIAVQQLKLSQAEAKSQVIQQQAQGNWTSNLQSAASYVAQFGGSVQTAMDQIYTSLGYVKNRNGTYSPRENMTGIPGQPTAGNAAGFLGSYARGAVLQVGEAGPETVAILRNPRAMMMGGGFGGGGGPVTIHLSVTVQGDIAGDATIAKMVRAVEDSFNRKAARLGMRSFVSAQG